MPSFELVAENNDKGVSLGVFDSDYLPRAGDTLACYGPEFGDGDHGDQGTDLFTVTAVGFEVHGASQRVHVPQMNKIANVRVYARSDRGPFIGLCACADDEVIPMTDDTCDNCNARLRRKFLQETKRR